LKVFLFILTVLLGVWLWRKNQARPDQDKTSNPSQPNPAANPSNVNALQPSPMQACLHCGLHMPESDMLKGQRGLYCSKAHCDAASDRPIG
jgi:uncharacterized protein